MNKHFLKNLVAIFVILGIGIIGIATPAYADGDNDTVISKALLQGLAKCYDNGALKNEIELKDVSNAASILNSAANTRNINIPNNLVGNFTYEQMSCKELVSGASTWFHGSSSSILKDKTVIPSSTSNYDTKVAFLKNMGYTAVEGSSKHCVHFKYDTTTSTYAAFVNPSEITSTVFTSSICADVDGNGEISSTLSIVKDAGSDSGIVGFELKDSKSAVQLDCALWLPTYGGCSKHSGAIGTKWVDFRQSVFSDLATNLPSTTKTIASGPASSMTITYNLSKDEDVASETETTEYKLSNNARNAMLEAFTGSSSIPSIDKDDQARLYITYLKNYYGAEQTCGELTEDQKTVYTGRGYEEYRKNSDGAMCYVHATKNTDKKVNGVASGALNYQGDNFESIVNWLKTYTGSVDVSLDTAETLNPEQSTETENENPEEKATCLNSGGAGTLGWIVCPLLESLGGVAEKFYEDQIKGQLQIEPELFTGGNGGTKQGWETFRTIANTAFIIVFLAVIFSQLTGVGINNYGIKKILPKLIVAAILINLSYWLCVALVDISNILGNSLQAMFNNLAEGLTVDSTVITDNAAKEVGTTLASVAIIGALVGTAGLVVWSNPAVILTLLISALGIVISLLFLFILLSVRQAAIVVLVVLSPLAVVAYVLPNTKSLFDKWWKLFKSLLLVYPITGLLVGGGNYVSRLLLSSGLGDKGTFEAATAMIAGIVPVFFIPTVLKNSLAAMGTLGTKLSGMGKTASGWATKKATNSEFNKNAQKMGLERKTRLRAGFNSNGELTRTGRMKAKFARTGVGRFIGSDKRLAIAQNAAKKNINAQEEANATLTNSLARAGIAESGGSPGDYYEQLFLKASQQGDEIGMNSAIAAAVSSGYMKEKDIAKMVRNAENNGNIRFKDAASRAAWLRDTATKYGNGFLATDAELKTFMQKGGDGALGDYGAYAASGGMGIDDFKPEDVSKLSGDSLAGMIASGVLTQGMAKRILASNPNISEDKKIMLSARAEGANVTDAGRFKEEAKALMGNHSATGVTDSSGVTTGFSQIVGTDAATIDRWTANNPLDVHETVRNYQDAQGNVYEVRRSQDGRHTDQGGFDVQIDPTGRNGLKPM